MIFLDDLFNLPKRVAEWRKDQDLTGDLLTTSPIGPFFED